MSKTDLWSSKGQFAKHLPHYRSRPEQRVLSRKVGEAFHHRQHLIAEAGTGTGKSLAYLAQAIDFAYRDNTQVVISTATINLQEQLVHQDIPAAIAVLHDAERIDASRFRYAVVKGMGNYLCRHNLDAALSRPADDNMLELLEQVAEWTNRTETGDRSELDLHHGAAAAWHAVSAQRHETCPHFQQRQGCFLANARQRAYDAHLIVVNHAFYLADLNNGGAVLGNVKHAVIDEAHKLEEVASSQFGWELNRSAIEAQLQPYLDDGSLSGAVAGVSAAWNAYWNTLELCLPDADAYNPYPQVTVTAELAASPEWQDQAEAAVNVKTATEHAVDAIQHDSAAAAQREDTHRCAFLEPLIELLPEAAGQIGGLAAINEHDHVRWISANPRAGVSVNSIPINVAPILQQFLFDKLETAILTSATLAAGENDFSLIRRQTGFPDQGGQLQLESPFDYPRQALLALPTDMPDPGRQYREYNAATADAVADIASACNGQTLALFTSYNALRDCDQAIRHRLENQGIAVMSQGADGRPESIIERYRDNPQSVILGTASFWEGVDLRDPPLRAVIICRLPFPVPTDPVISARSAMYPHPFLDYHLPQAIIRFRQGAGRLIRSDQSKGAVIVLDPRAAQRYNRQFIKALPQYHQIEAPIADILTATANWIR